ncbi:MAG: hypothetical protein P8181_13450, partial [bacterium]
KVTMEKEEGRSFYLIHVDNAKFRVAETSDGLGLFLKILAEKHYYFEGGVTMTAVEDYGERMKSKVAGTLEIQYLKFGDRIITG